MQTPEMIKFGFKTQEDAQAFLDRKIASPRFDNEFLKMYEETNGWIVETAGDNRYYTYAK